MVCHLGQEGEVRGLGDIWVERWGREKVEKQVSKGPLHVLDRKGTEVWLLRSRVKGEDKGVCDPSPTEEFDWNSPGLCLLSQHNY